MIWVTFWIFPAALAIGSLIEKLTKRRFDKNASETLAPVDTHAVDQAIVEDIEVARLDALWDLPCAPGSLPMRPFDPAPHTYPRRPARHSSHNRLHRGF